jgi:hypothetical protein
MFKKMTTKATGAAGWQKRQGQANNAVSNNPAPSFLTMPQSFQPTSFQVSQGQSTQGQNQSIPVSLNLTLNLPNNLMQGQGGNQGNNQAPMISQTPNVIDSLMSHGLTPATPRALQYGSTTKKTQTLQKHPLANPCNTTALI